MYVHPSASPSANDKALWLVHSTVDSLNNKSVTVTSEDGYISLVMTEKAYNTFKEQIQVEIGCTDTGYEPYVMPTAYTPAADGTVSGVTSLSPDMSLLTNTDGIIINAEYNRDLNKVIAKLEQSLLQ